MEEKRRYKFICYEDRLRIAELLNKGYTQTNIADRLGYSRTAISKEFRRAGVNREGRYPDGTVYDADLAQRCLRK